MRYRTATVDFIALGALVTYLLVVVSGGFFLHHGTTMNMTYCPLLAGQEIVCPMDALTHIEGWMDMTRAIVSTFEALTVAGILFIFFRFFYNTTSPPENLYIKQVFRRIPPDLYQALYSQGILHPKAP